MLSVRTICKRVRRLSRAQITRQLRTATAAQTQRPSLGVASTVSITAAIINDHRDLEECYNEVVNSNDQDRRQRYGNQFTWELARHSVGEELVLYPAFERHMGSVGYQMAETDRKDHHEASGAHWPTTDSDADG